MKKKTALDIALAALGKIAGTIVNGQVDCGTGKDCQRYQTCAECKAARAEKALVAIEKMGAHDA